MNRPWEIAAAAVIVTHLVAQALGAQVLADGTQVLLVPALAGAVWNRAEVPRGTFAARLYAGALVFSWVGDAAPRVFEDQAGFIAMVAAFGVAQLCFLATFHRMRRRRLHPAVLVGYLVGSVALFAAGAAGAGSLLPLGVGYVLVLVAAAGTAARVNLLTGIGGVVFFVSGSLIGLESFSSWYAMPAHDLLVMITYIAAQLLIAAGLLRRWREAPQLPDDDARPGDSAKTGDWGIEQSA